MAGVLLITVPARNENINNNVHAAATETIDGIEYTVVELFASTNSGTTYQFGNTGNVKIILQEDYIRTATYQWWGEAAAYSYNKIIDLNGFTLSLQQLDINTKNLEIRDSSAKQTGKILCADALRIQTHSAFALYGGVLQAPLIQYGFSDANTRIYGGTVQCERASGGSVVYVAPHLQATYDANGRVLTCAPVAQMIDGEAYQVVMLRGDSDPEQSKNAFFGGESTENYYYLLLNDWDFKAHKVGWVAGHRVRGHKIIIDLQGHSMKTTDSAGGGYYPEFYCATLELTDSALTGGSFGTVSLTADVQTVICSGNVSCAIACGSRPTKVDVVIRGGRAVTLSFFGNGLSGDANLIEAPYMVPNNNSNTYTTYRPTHAAYLVSDSNIVSGIYNYEIGLEHELTVGELGKLNAPADKTYYLWGRNADGSYEYLGIEYRDGEWRKVA